MTDNMNVDLTVYRTTIKLQPLHDPRQQPQTFVFKVPQPVDQQWLSRVNFQNVLSSMHQGMTAGLNSCKLELVCFDDDGRNHLVLPADCNPMDDKCYKYLSRCIHADELQLVAQFVNIASWLFVEP